MNHDPLLDIVIKIAIGITDSSDGVLPTAITVQCGGLLVSGIIISQRDFLMSHPIPDHFLEHTESLKLTNEETPEADDSFPVFLHLSHTRFFTPGQIPIPAKGDGGFWRCRLSEVSGFHFGLLETVPN